jgi:hypothetical protein
MSRSGERIGHGVLGLAGMLNKSENHRFAFCCKFVLKGLADISGGGKRLMIHPE